MISWWQFWTDPAVKPTIEAMVDAFEKANPGIKVELTDLTWANGHEKIVLAFSSGTAPDVIELGARAENSAQSVAYLIELVVFASHLIRHCCRQLCATPRATS